jgi:hypothetical protein
MSRTPAASSHSHQPLTWFASRIDTPVGLAAMLAVGLLVRLLIAPRAGYYHDLKLFQAWAQRLAEVGPRSFYATDFVALPPGYLYVLWLLGKISSPPGFLLLKIPAILGDLALAVIAGVFASRLAPGLAERAPLRALVVAAVVFNPAFLMDSTVWGQVDVVQAVCVLAALMLLLTGPASLVVESLAFVAFVAAISMKPQSGFVLPVMLYALYRRHFVSTERRQVSRLALHIAVPGALALAFWFVVAVPFGLGPVELVRFYRDAASGDPVTSALAFNLWGAIGFRLPDVPGARYGDGQLVPGRAVELGSVPALHLGTVLLVAGAAVVLWRAHRAIVRGGDEPLVLMVAAATTSLLAFGVLTRMHERYMLYSLAFLAPLLFVRELRIVYTILSSLFVVNLWWVYAYDNSRGAFGHGCALPFPGCVAIDPLLGGFDFDAWQKKAFSVAVVATALAMAWFGPDWAARQHAQSFSDRLTS